MDWDWDCVVECCENTLVLVLGWLLKILEMLGYCVAYCTNSKILWYGDIGSVFQYEQRWFGCAIGYNGQPGGRFEIVELLPSPAIRGLVIEIIYNSDQFTVLTNEGNMYACTFSCPKNVGGDLYGVEIQVVESLNACIGVQVDHIDYVDGKVTAFTDIAGSRWVYCTEGFRNENLKAMCIRTQKLNGGALCKYNLPCGSSLCFIADFRENFEGITGDGELLEIDVGQLDVGRIDSVNLLISRRPLFPYSIVEFDRKSTGILDKWTPAVFLQLGDSRVCFFRRNKTNVGYDPIIYDAVMPWYFEDSASIVGCYTVYHGVYLLDRIGRWFYADLDKADDLRATRDMSRPRALVRTVRFEEIGEYRGMEFLGGGDCGYFSFALIDRENQCILIEHNSHYPTEYGSVRRSKLQHRMQFYSSIIKSPLTNYLAVAKRSTKSARTSDLVNETQI